MYGTLIGRIMAESLCKISLTDRDVVWSQESIVRWGAHWRHLATTIEPSMYGGDPTCCQITLTTEKLECAPMLNVMAALPNIGGALYSTPESLVDAHY